MSAGSAKSLVMNLGREGLSLFQLLSMAKMASSGMTYLEGEAIIHCDLALRNLLATPIDKGFLRFRFQSLKKAF